MNSPPMIRKGRELSRSIFSIWFIVALILSSEVCKDSKNSSEKYLQALPQIESAVAKLLSRYHIDAKSIKRRNVQSSDGTFTRIEKRISVESEFNSLNFNYDLNQAVSEFGATAIASEKSEDKSVTMHIKKDGVILQSVVFVVKKE